MKVKRNSSLFVRPKQVFYIKHQPNEIIAIFSFDEPYLLLLHTVYNIILYKR